jgi:hypothetical protein
MRKQFLLLLSAFSFFHSNAQTEKKADFELEKDAYTYVGIQANLLLQQFISFNSNSSINTNPYIFSYVRSSRNGGGFALGTGFNVSQNSSNDGVSSVNTENANVTIRLGYEKKYLQNEKLIPLWGIEMGMGGIYNKTTSRLDQTFNNNVITVETTKLFFGPSFRGGLLYAFSKHILIGTESYFNCQIAFTQTSTSNGFGGVGQSFVPFNIGFQAPTALYLIYRY